MNLEAFIAREAAQPFAYGSHDCATTADKWVKEVTGFSPMARFGRVYTKQIEAEEWLSEPGSLAVAINRVMRKCGLKKTGKPRKGDVGLIVWKDKVFVAIHAGDGWFSRAPDGLIIAPLTAWRKAWRIA